MMGPHGHAHAFPVCWRIGRFEPNAGYLCAPEPRRGLREAPKTETLATQVRRAARQQPQAQEPSPCKAEIARPTAKVATPTGKAHISRRPRRNVVWERTPRRLPVALITPAQQ